MTTTSINGTIKFNGRYIAEPYWPERAMAIDIDKQSGVSRAKSELGRTRALDAHLKKIGMSMDDLDELKKRAARPFYTVSDINDTDARDNAAVSAIVSANANAHNLNEIVIPPDRILACFVQGCDEAPSAIRIGRPDQVRSILKVEPIYTGKLKPDGTWVRAVVPKKDGKPLSNQRSTRSSPYIERFSGDLIVSFDTSQMTSQRLQDFIIYVGREIGIGASRKMNCGRFVVEWNNQNKPLRPRL